MKKLFTKFFKEEDGATIVEYVIMLSIVAAIVLFAFPSLRKSIVSWITDSFKDIGSGKGGTHNPYICPDGTETTDLSTCK
ncbi:hypothetical protein R3O67_27880 [Bacillus cereus]|uniref:Flp family type IVb pilin n=1 Tax=Bacillus cereus TaxID=1396 RepID=UPI00307A41AE